jgi:hypothetical protein
VPARRDPDAVTAGAVRLRLRRQKARPANQAAHRWQAQKSRGSTQITESADTLAATGATKTLAKADTADRVRALAIHWGWRIGLVLALTAFTWTTLPLEPQANVGLDDSWQAALHMAVHNGVSFGNHFIFTYGPLGFLSVPTLWYTSTGALAFLYAILVRAALVAGLFVGARRSYGPWGGAAIALVVGCASPYNIGLNIASLETISVLIFAVAVVDRVRSESQVTLAVAAAGVAAGFEMLGKLSTGTALSLMMVLMALGACGSRGKHLAVGVGAALSAMIVGWLATGQNLAELPNYIAGSEQIVTGYAAAMGITTPGLGWEYTAAAVAFVFGLLGALEMGRDGSSRRRWSIVALWVAFCFLEFKESFVRDDTVHAPIFFIGVMGGFLAFSWQRGNRLAGLAMLATLFTFALASLGATFGSVFTPGGDVSSAVTQLGQVLNGSDRDTLINEGRASVQAVYAIDPTTLGLVRGHTVAIEPYDAAAAWGYQLDWRPLPVIQTYSAYTTTLDEDDANALDSSYAPQRILRNREPGIDGRYQPFDEPATTRATLCRYRQLSATAAWQVLARGPDLCSAPVIMSTVHTGWGEVVPVPAPPNAHSFVFVRISGVQVGGLESLAALLDKPAQRDILLNGAFYRLVEGTAADGLLLRSSSGIDYPAPWNLAPQVTTISVSEAGQPSGSGAPITYAFYYQDVR